MGFFAILHRAFWHNVRCFHDGSRENLIGPLCRQDAGTLFLVGILVLGEVLDLDNLDAIHLVAHDQSVFREVIQAGVNVEAIPREEVNADLLGLVEQAPFTVCQRPQAGEKHPYPDVTVEQFRVREETGFDVARACHQLLRSSNQKTHGLSVLGNSKPTDSSHARCFLLK